MVVERKTAGSFESLVDCVERASIDGFEKVPGRLGRDCDVVVARVEAGAMRGVQYGLAVASGNERKQRFNFECGERRDAIVRGENDACLVEPTVVVAEEEVCHRYREINDSRSHQKVSEIDQRDHVVSKKDIFVVGISVNELNVRKRIEVDFSKVRKSSLDQFPFVRIVDVREQRSRSVSKIPCERSVFASNARELAGASRESGAYLFRGFERT